MKRMTLFPCFSSYVVVDDQRGSHLQELRVRVSLQGTRTLGRSTNELACMMCRTLFRHFGDHPCNCTVGGGGNLRLGTFVIGSFVVSSMTRRTTTGTYVMRHPRGDANRRLRSLLASLLGDSLEGVVHILFGGR